MATNNDKLVGGLAENGGQRPCVQQRLASEKHFLSWILGKFQSRSGVVVVTKKATLSFFSPSFLAEKKLD